MQSDIHNFETHSQAVDLLTKYYVKHKGFKIKTPNTNKNEVFRIRNKETCIMIILKDDLTIMKKRKYGHLVGYMTTEEYEEAKVDLELNKPLEY